MQRDSAIWVHERKKKTNCFILRLNLQQTATHRLPEYSENYIVSKCWHCRHEVWPDSWAGCNKTCERKFGNNGETLWFICKSPIPIFGAMPDGVIDEDGLVEIKCPSSCTNFTPEEAIKLKKFTLFSISNQTNEIKINKKHKYYFQMQGQMKVANRKYCLFVLWTPLGGLHCFKWIVL